MDITLTELVHMARQISQKTGVTVNAAMTALDIIIRERGADFALEDYRTLTEIYKRIDEISGQTRD